MTTWGQKEPQQKLGKKNRKKNKCVDISSDTLENSSTRISRNCYQKETLKEKQNLLF